MSSSRLVELRVESTGERGFRMWSADRDGSWGVIFTFQDDPGLESNFCRCKKDPIVF